MNDLTDILLSVLGIMIVAMRFPYKPQLNRDCPRRAWLTQFGSLPSNHKDPGFDPRLCQELNICVTLFSAKANSVFHPFWGDK